MAADIPQDIVSEIVGKIALSTPLIQNRFADMRQRDELVHENLQYIHIAQEIYQRHVRNCNFQENIKSLTREQLEDRENYARAISIELIESVVHMLFNASAAVRALIAEHKAAAKAAGVEVDVQNQMDPTKSHSGGGDGDGGDGDGGDEDAHADADADADADARDADDGHDDGPEAKRRRRLAKLAADLGADTANLIDLDAAVPPTPAAGAKPHKKVGVFGKKATPKAAASSAASAPPALSCLADGLAESDLHPILSYSAHLYTPEKVEQFLREFLGASAKHPLSAVQLMRGTSADLRFRMLDAYTTCNSLQSIKVEACQMSYDDVDVVIQELDARLKEYEDRVREEIGLVLTPDDMVGVKANRRLCDAINRNASAAHNKHGLKQARDDAEYDDESGEVSAPLAVAAANPKRKNSAAAAGGDDTSRNGAGVVANEEWDVPADPNEPVYCLCQRVSYGEMVACENDDCPYEWFHFGCVGLRAPPKNKWYCPECRELPQFAPKSK